MGPCGVERADLSAIFDGFGLTRRRSRPTSSLSPSARELERLAHRHVYDRALIDDVVQEALLEVMSSHAGSDPPGR